jgi:hypothetical protein
LSKIGNIKENFMRLLKQTPLFTKAILLKAREQEKEKRLTLTEKLKKETGKTAISWGKAGTPDRAGVGVTCI